MDEQNTIQETEQVDYVKAIQDLKATTVSKDKYNSVLQENQQLLDALISGGQIEQLEDNKPGLTELANKLAENKRMNNIEYISTMCDFYDRLCEAGFGDLAITVKHGGAYSDSEAEAVTRTINGLKELVAEADGDNNAFTALYQSYVRDVSIPKK